MVLRRLRGDVEAGGDLGVRAALADEVEHLALADAEVGRRHGPGPSAERVRIGAPSWRRRAAARSMPPTAPSRSNTATAARASSIARGVSPVALSDSREREPSGAGEVRTVAEALAGTLEVRDRRRVVARGRGDTTPRELRLSGDRVDLGRRQVGERVSGIGRCARGRRSRSRPRPAGRAARRRGGRRPSSPSRPRRAAAAASSGSPATRRTRAMGSHARTWSSYGAMSACASSMRPCSMRIPRGCTSSRRGDRSSATRSDRATRS